MIEILAAVHLTTSVPAIFDLTAVSAQPGVQTIVHERVPDVLFETGSAEISAAGRSTLEIAAQRFLARSESYPMLVSGMSDTVGSEARNMALSERRAQAVRDVLIAFGIPADRIRTRGLGETDLAVASRDGVSEPLNRRVRVEF